MKFRNNPTTHERKKPTKRSWDALSSRQKTTATLVGALALATSGAALAYHVTSAESPNYISDYGVTVKIADIISGSEIPEAPPPPPLPGKVQVSNLMIGTYNAWWVKEDSKKTINDVLNLMRGTATTPGVDVLGVQEFKGDNEPEEFKKIVPLCNTCEFNAYIPDSEASAMPIIWKPSKVTGLSAETIFLHPKVEADGANIASKWVNIVLFQDNTSGIQFYHFNFHLVYGIQNGNELNLDNPERLELLDLELGGLVPKIEDIKLSGIPIIATYDGNMTANSTNISSPKNILVDLGFKDSHDPAVPDNTPQEQGTHKDRDIDYVTEFEGFEPQLQILGSWTVGDTLLDLASDHDALIVNIGMLKNAA